MYYSQFTFWILFSAQYLLPKESLHRRRCLFFGGLPLSDSPASPTTFSAPKDCFGGSCCNFSWTFFGGYECYSFHLKFDFRRLDSSGTATALTGRRPYQHPHQQRRRICGISSTTTNLRTSNPKSTSPYTL